MDGVVHGCWQLSHGHGRPWTDEEAFAALDRAAEADSLTLDCADIYTGVEALLGRWLAARPGAVDRVRIHTKFVPDLDALAEMDRAYVRRVVLRSRDRLGVSALDLVQFYWWDWRVPGWLQTCEWLAELRDEGVIRNLGATNMDEVRLARLLEAGFPVSTNQVQLSLLDRRPSKGLADLCVERGIGLLCYGALAGGLLSETWAGRDWTEVGASRSLIKYRLIVDEVGGWPVLQRALEALAEVAALRGCTVADVAVAYARSQPGVEAVIVGLSRGRARGRLGRAVERLEPEEVARIEAAVPETVPGAVYELERDRSGPHGRIMRYDLNRHA